MMRALEHRAVAAAAAALLALGPTSAGAQRCDAAAPAAAPAHRAVIAAARALVRDSMAAGKITGLSVTVAIDGAIVWSEGFGFADVENHAPVSRCTRFRIASVSKALTGVALAQLHERGTLDLDAPVQRYVPAFPAKPWPITTRQIAGHLAGIRHYRGDEVYSMRHYEDVLAGLAIFQDDSLLFEPGTRESYSTYGYSVLSAVVEGASGDSFLAYMRRNIFDPLGMRSTVAEFPDSILEHRARFYAHDEKGTLLNAPYVDNSYKWAGGGFLSNTDDLARFGSALLRPGFLGREALALLFTTQHTRDGAPTDYGLGWQLDWTEGGRVIPRHSGGAVGGNAHLALYPDERMVIAVLANSETGYVGGGRVVRQIARHFKR
jgi:CubicO group peptidase (beta-lactamase class C family)